MIREKENYNMANVRANPRVSEPSEGCVEEEECYPLDA
jgi:hypothetical protein